MRLEEDVTVQQLLQGRSPALDLDSLYGLGPDNRFDRRFYEDDGIRLKSGTTQGIPGADRHHQGPLAGFDLPRVGAGSLTVRATTAADPGSAQRREPRRRADPQRLHPLPQPVRDRARRQGRFQRGALRVGARGGRQALPVDAGPRLPAADRRRDRHRRGLRQGAQALRALAGRTRTARRCRSSSPWPPTVSATAWCATSTSGTGSSARAAPWPRWSCCSASPAPAATSPRRGDINDPESGSFERLPTNWVADFRRLFDFPEGGRPDLAVTAAEFNLTKRIDTLMVEPAGETAARLVRRTPAGARRRHRVEPGVPEPHPGQHGGLVSATGISRWPAAQGEAVARLRLRQPATEPSSPARSRRSSSGTARCGSTSSARPR